MLCPISIEFCLNFDALTIENWRKNWAEKIFSLLKSFNQMKPLIYVNPRQVGGGDLTST